MVEVRALTLRNAEGQLYARLPAVDGQIGAALALPSAALLVRSHVRDTGHPDHLKDECLVHLIREHHRAGNRDLVERLSQELIERAKGIVYHAVRSLGPERARVAFDEVVEDLFTRILDPATDRGDFYEVRFGQGLKRLAITTFNKYTAAQRTAQQTVAWQDLPGYDGDAAAGDERRGGVTPADLPATPAFEHDLVRRQAAAQALNSLGEPYRTAYVLRYYHEWPVHDADPHHPSLSRYFNVTPRTIRYWFAHAEHELARWREGQA